MSPLSDLPASVRLVLDIEPRAEPVRGWLEGPDRARVPFTGLLGLLSALERVTENAPANGASDRG